ncbi:hypothetical protein [Salibacterium salarium]|nr:hypothetical protein [Salibacterium salarium]
MKQKNNHFFGLERAGDISLSDEHTDMKAEKKRRKRPNNSGRLRFFTM